MNKTEITLMLALEALENPWKAGPNGVADAITAIKQALEQPEPEPVAWRPIESAPKDGTFILLMYMHIDTQIVHNGFWIDVDDTDDENDVGWWSYEYSEVSRIKLDDWMMPTHWMPLPSIKE